MQKRSYDLDAKDFFWEKNAASPFPQVAEEIDSELTKCGLLSLFPSRAPSHSEGTRRYKNDAAEITKSTGIGDLSDVSQMCVSLSRPLRDAHECTLTAI